MQKRLYQSLTLVLLLTGSVQLASAQTSWGDTQTSGTRESASTGLFTPGRQAFDGNSNTAWQLTPGATSGWVERYWATPQKFVGASVNLSIPKGSQLQFSYLGNGNWVPIPGAVIVGPFNGIETLTFPGEMPATTKILTSLVGTSAGQTQIFEINFIPNVYPQSFGKILPQSYTFNQSEYINLKPSRLWNGIIDNPWFSPLWSFPWEVFQTNSANQPTGIFPPYYGNPPQDGTIIWQLDGTYTVQTLKAYFIQNYQSIQFDFWNGSQWANSQTFGPGWTDSGQGWQRIDLKTPVTTTKIRITFPGGWGRAQYIGQVEVWGTGVSDTTPQALAIPPVDSDGSYHLTLNSTTVQDYQLEVTVGGSTNNSLTGQWNGSALSVAPSAWIGEDTVYRVILPQGSLRTDAQFLKLIPSGPLHSVVFKNGANHGLIDLGWPYDEGQFSNTTAGPSQPVPSITNQKWSLGNTYQLERLRVYTGSVNPGTFTTLFGERATAVSWASEGNGWWEAVLDGITADHLAFESSVPITLDQIQLWGTPQNDTQVAMEIWWPLPNTPVTSAANDSNSVIGWMGDPSVQPLIGGYHPRQADYLFWMPLNQMNLAPGQQQSLLIQGSLGALSNQFPWTVNWTGNLTPATLDQGTALFPTTQSTTTISGTVVDSRAQCWVNGAKIPVSGGRFSTSLTLTDGFQLVDVQIWNSQKTILEAEFIKPIYKTVGEPVIQFDQPSGPLFTQSNSLNITGRVGNGLGLTLTLNGAAVTLTDNVFSQTVPLADGTQSLIFVLKDNAGRETDQTLVVNQDSTTPVVQIQAPLAGQYLAYSQVTFQVTGGPDSQMWWQANGGPWQPGYTQTINPTYTFADGFYTYTFVAQDRSGNLSAPSSVSFCVDTTPPLPFTIGANVTGWTNNNTPTLTFATTDTTSGVDHYEALIDTGSFSTVTSPYQLPALSDGVHTVYIKAVDRAGNATIESITLSIDTAIPATPINFTQVPGQSEVDLSWTGVPEPGVLAPLPLTYRIERSPAWPDGIHTATTTSYNDTGLTLGSSYSYRVTAVDVAGNLSAASAWLNSEVGLANVAINPSGPTTVNFNQASVTLPANAAASDVTGVQINELPIQLLNDQPTNTLVSSIFQFRAVRTINGTTSTTDHADFTAPVAIQLAYDPSKIPTGMTDANLKPYYYDSMWGRWLPIAGAFVDTQSHQVYFQSNHFTDFSVQASDDSELSAQQIRDVPYNPGTTAISHAPVFISSQEGVASTSFTEFSLPGKGGFNLAIKRVYDTGRAQSDATSLDPTKDGSYPWSLGPGWRINFPFLKWNGSGLWITDPDGRVFSFGQTQLVNATGSNGSVQVLTYENHEGTDATLQVTLNPIAHYLSSYLFLLQRINPPPTYTYSLASAVLWMKDGREVDFDNLGRVTQILDAAHENTIAFGYSGNQATSITDSLGRVVNFDYKGGNNIQKIWVVAGSGNGSNSATYSYNSDGTLASATDVKGRSWTYAYTPQTLTNETVVLTGGYLSPSPTTTTVRALTSVSGPGIGTSTIAYEVLKGTYTTSEVVASTNTTINMTVSDTRLLAYYLSVGLDANTPVRNTSYQYTMVSNGDDQFYVSLATTNDGRAVTTTNYLNVSKSRQSLSNAPEAIQSATGYDAGYRPDTNEVLNYPSSVTLASAASAQTVGGSSETQKMVWDWDANIKGSEGLGKLLETTTIRSANTTLDTTFSYDGWGNTTQSITKSVVTGPDGIARQSQLEDDYRYYQTGSADLTIGGTTWQVTPQEQTLKYPRKNLLATHVRTIGQWNPGNTGITPDSNSTQKSEYLYSDLGLLSTQYQWAGGTQWATIGYSYDEAGEVNKVTGPLPNQETDYSYSYPNSNGVPTAPSYTITTTKVGVNLGVSGPATNLATINTYNYLDGTNLSTQDPLLNTTTRTFDPLGRVLTLTEPAVSVGTPVTTVKYNDTPTSLTSTVSSPSMLTTTYTFDALGRLVTVVKLDNSTGETLTTNLSYDAWDEVTTLVGPISSLDSQLTIPRTSSNLVTTFTYDFRGRVTSEQAPGAVNPKTSTYTDSQNLVTTYDEMNNETTQVLDWTGKPLVSIVYPSSGTALVTTTYYDGAGRLTTSIDPSQYETDHSYNPQGLEASITAPSRTIVENQTNFTGRPVTNKNYDLAGNLVQVSQPSLGNGPVHQASYTANTAGQVIESRTNVTSQGQSTLVVVDTTYDNDGNKISQSTGYLAGSSTTKSWSYDSHNRVLGEIDELGRTVSYSYDLVGNRTSVTDPRNGLYAGSFVLTLKYNQFNRLIQATLPSVDPNNLPTIGFTYDGSGNLVQRQEADSQLTKYSYSLRNQLLTETVTDPASSASYQTTRVYDDAGRETSVTTPSGHVVEKIYDTASRVKEVDQNGQPWTLITYDPDGNKSSVTTVNQPSNELTKYQYNPEGLTTVTTDPMGNMSRTYYDSWNNLSQTTDAAGNFRNYSYDEMGRKVLETTPWGKTITTTYDAWGNNTGQVDAKGTSFVRTFTLTNLLLSETATDITGTQNLVRTFTYDEGGQTVTAIDNGVTTHYNASSGSYQPDPYGLIRSKADTLPSTTLTMGYGYDTRQRLTSALYPDGTSVGYTYNQLNQVSAMPGWIASGSLTYDSSGRISSMVLGNTVVKSWGYDSQDRVNNLQYVAAGVDIKGYNLTYDNAGNITNKTQSTIDSFTNSPKNNPSTYAYDGLNQIVSAQETGWFQKKPEDLQGSIQFATSDRDYQGTTVLNFTVQPVITPATDSVALDMASRSVGINLGAVYGVNKIKITPTSTTPRVRQQDLSVYISSDNNAVSGTTGDYTLVTGWTFVQNADGSIVLEFPKIFEAQYIKINTIWDDRDVTNASVATGATVINVAQELIKVWTLANNRQELDTYDSIGNRQSQTVDGKLANYSYYTNSTGGNLSWLETDGTWFYQYDSNGNLILKAKAASVDPTQPTNSATFVPDTTQEYWTYTWDLRNRLIAVSKNGQLVASYLYDAENLRVSRSTPTDTTVYAYGRKGVLTYQKNLTTGVARTYTYLNDQTIGWTDTAADGTQSSYYATTDHLGSVTGVTDSNGNLVWQSEYQPFGKTAGIEGLYDFDSSYAGHQVDKDTGLIYMWNRWQDPNTGRFIGEDSARSGSNYYAYAGNNPLRYLDKNGLQTFDEGDQNYALISSQQTLNQMGFSSTDALTQYYAGKNAQSTVFNFGVVIGNLIGVLTGNPYVIGGLVVSDFNALGADLSHSYDPSTLNQTLMGFAFGVTGTGIIGTSGLSLGSVSSFSLNNALFSGGSNWANYMYGNFGTDTYSNTNAFLSFGLGVFGVPIGTFLGHAWTAGGQLISDIESQLFGIESTKVSDTILTDWQAFGIYILPNVPLPAPTAQNQDLSNPFPGITGPTVATPTQDQDLSNPFPGITGPMAAPLAPVTPTLQIPESTTSEVSQEYDSAFYSDPTSYDLGSDD